MPYAVIEKSGSGIVKDVAKLRIDCFLNPDDPNYDRCYVSVPVIPPEGYPGKVDKEGTPKDPKDYDAWLESLPHIWQNNPFHHNKIWLPDAGASDNYIKEQIERTLTYFYNFHQHCWDTGVPFIENWKKVPKVKGSIRDIFVRGEAKDLPAHQQKVADVLSRVQEFQIGVSRVPPTDLNIGEKGTITIGAAAEARGTGYTISYTDIYDRTVINYNGAASASGIIDTVDSYWRVANATPNVRFGTFTDNESGSFTCHDAEAVGSVSTGDNPPITGLSIDVTAGEFIGCDDIGPSPMLGIEADSPEGSGVYWVNGDHCVASDTQTYTLSSSYVLSLYGTGTESGGGEDYPINLSVGLTASVSIDRDVAYGRALTPGLTAAVSLARKVSYHRASSTALAISTTIARSWNRIISTATALSVATSILKGWGRTISTSTALGISTTISRQVAYNRATSAALSVSTTISRAITYTRATASSLSASVTVARSVAYNRAVSTALGIVTSIVATLRSEAFPINFTVSLHPRALTVKLNKRSLNIELHKQDMTVKVRNEQ